MFPNLQKGSFNARSPELHGNPEDLIPEHIRKCAWSTPKHGDESHVIPEFDDLSAIYPTSSIAGSEASRRKAGMIQLPRNRSVIYFGFVAIGESARFQHKFTNISNEQLRFECYLDSDSGFFKVENSELIVRPKEEAVVTLTYKPTGLHYNSNRLHLKKLNGIVKIFSFKVCGYGGKADVSVLDEYFQNGTMHKTLSGPLVFFPDFFPPPPSLVNPTCSLTLVNKGNRRAFIRIQAVNKRGEELSENHIRITPARCIIERDEKFKKFKIRVISCFNTDQRNTSSSMSIPSTRNDCSIRLRVMWGEETQRLRLKLWQSRGYEKCLINGEDFSQSYGEHEKVSKDLDRLEFFEHEADEFKNFLRIFEIKVVDNRLGSLYELE